MKVSYCCEIDMMCNNTYNTVMRYLNLRAPELAGLTFTKGGTIVTHNMGIDSLYQKFKEYKHDHNKHENQVQNNSHMCLEMSMFLF